MKFTLALRRWGLRRFQLGEVLHRGSRLSVQPCARCRILVSLAGWRGVHWQLRAAPTCHSASSSASWTTAPPSSGAGTLKMRFASSSASCLSPPEGIHEEDLLALLRPRRRSEGGRRSRSPSIERGGDRALPSTRATTSPRDSSSRARSAPRRRPRIRRRDHDSAALSDKRTEFDKRTGGNVKTITNLGLLMQNPAQDADLIISAFTGVARRRERGRLQRAQEQAPVSPV